PPMGARPLLPALRTDPPAGRAPRRRPVPPLARRPLASRPARSPASAPATPTSRLGRRGSNGAPAVLPARGRPHGPRGRSPARARLSLPLGLRADGGLPPRPRVLGPVPRHHGHRPDAGRRQRADHRPGRAASGRAPAVLGANRRDGGRRGPPPPGHRRGDARPPDPAAPARGRAPAPLDRRAAGPSRRPRP